MIFYFGLSQCIWVYLYESKESPSEEHLFKFQVTALLKWSMIYMDGNCSPHSKYDARKKNGVSELWTSSSDLRAPFTTTFADEIQKTVLLCWES